MKNKFSALKKALEKEFTLFMVQENITFANIELKIYEDEIEPHANAFVSHQLEKEKPECAIFLFINTNKAFDEHDVEMMKKYQIEKDYDLFFWMLYHEMGHLVQMQQIFNEKGMEELQKELKFYEKMVETIQNDIEEGQISEKDGARKYRELEEEKNADKFADLFYKMRKKEIHTIVKKINREEKK